MYYALRRIFETLRHMPMDNTIGNTSFIMLCFLHIGTIDVLFLNKCSLFHLFQSGLWSGATNATPMQLSLGMAVSCFLLCFFVSVFCGGKKCVLYDKKNIFLSHCSSVKIIVNNVAWYLPASRFIFILNKGQQIRRSVLIFLQNPPFRRYFCKNSNPQYC